MQPNNMTRTGHASLCRCRSKHSLSLGNLTLYGLHKARAVGCISSDSRIRENKSGPQSILNTVCLIRQWRPGQADGSISSALWIISLQEHQKVGGMALITVLGNSSPNFMLKCHLSESLQTHLGIPHAFTYINSVQIE